MCSNLSRLPDTDSATLTGEIETPTRRIACRLFDFLKVN